MTTEFNRLWREVQRKTELRELMLEMLMDEYAVDYAEIQWENGESYLVLGSPEYPEDLMKGLAADVRVGKRTAINKLLWMCGDPACGNCKAMLLSGSRLDGDQVRIDADCPWLDQFDEAHYRQAEVILTADDVLRFPSGGEIDLKEFWLVPSDEIDDEGNRLSYIGRR